MQRGIVAFSFIACFSVGGHFIAHISALWKRAEDSSTGAETEAEMGANQ